MHKVISPVIPNVPKGIWNQDKSPSVKGIQCSALYNHPLYFDDTTCDRVYYNRNIYHKENLCA